MSNLLGNFRPLVLRPWVLRHRVFRPRVFRLLDRFPDGDEGIGSEDEEPSDLATAVKRRQEDIKRKEVEEREEREKQEQEKMKERKFREQQASIQKGRAAQGLTLKALKGLSLDMPRIIVLGSVFCIDIIQFRSEFKATKTCI